MSFFGFGGSGSLPPYIKKEFKGTGELEGWAGFGKYIPSPLKPDDNRRYLNRIIARFKAQEAKGIGKYGQVLEDNHAAILERFEHLAQELTDALMYIEWAKEEIGERK